ncbi:Chemotaxis protein CheY [Pirellula sp. SH-Sr6A]|uniref:response regulator n=1 Tax=Pirellula sp. SH-Sr6A TaxID=1632865 RepID=UPI00078D5240|nr:response regulator [Pirellula sp. SH-Sr6A]AMV35410.1 Chemotaxis protein CheY [Pirellula sp. SH-Sr6A]
MTKRVLIVDDAMIMRMRIREAAIEAGWEVAAEAADGFQAIELYRLHRPDLVTMDIVMPIADGVEALRTIRIDDTNARVCMISAVNQQSKLSECIRLGAIDFLIKPVDKKQLASLFEKQGR